MGKPHDEGPAIHPVRLPLADRTQKVFLCLTALHKVPPSAEEMPKFGILLTSRKTSYDLDSCYFVTEDSFTLVVKLAP